MKHVWNLTMSSSAIQLLLPPGSFCVTISAAPYLFHHLGCRCPCGVHPRELFVTSNRSTNGTGAACVIGDQEVYRAETDIKAKVYGWFGTISLDLLLSSLRACFPEKKMLSLPSRPLFLVYTDIFVWHSRGGEGRGGDGGKGKGKGASLVFRCFSA